MQRSRLNKFLAVILLLLFCHWKIAAQEVINNVSMEKLSSTSFKVRYKLNNNKDYQLKEVTLKIFRRRNDVVEEIYSKSITPSLGLRADQTYSYNWNTDTKTLKDGDELQARVLVSYNKPVTTAPTSETS